MTPAQVRTALKAFDAGLKITEVSGYYTYSDGVTHTLQTPQFLDKLEATPAQAYASSRKTGNPPRGCN
jgi:sulfur transfer complex TusBCD TusB component (DsrH family)